MRQNRPIEQVFEGNVAELDLAAQSRSGASLGPILQFTLHLHDFDNAFGGRDRPVIQNRGTAQRTHRAEEISGVGEEYNHISRGQPPCEYTSGSVPDHDRQAEGANQVGQGPDPRLIAHALEIGLQVFFASGFEALIDLFFLRQTLHDADRGEHLLRQGRHRSRALAGATSSPLYAPRVVKDQGRQKRDNR